MNWLAMGAIGPFLGISSDYSHRGESTMPPPDKFDDRWYLIGAAASALNDPGPDEAQKLVVFALP